MPEHNQPDHVPSWCGGKRLNEIAFCEAFLKAHPMVYVDGNFFTKEGRITNIDSIRKDIHEILRPYYTSGSARRANNLLELLKIEAYAEDLPLQEDRLHVANGTLFFSGTFSTEKSFAETVCLLHTTPMHRHRRPGSAFYPICWSRRISSPCRNILATA